MKSIWYYGVVLLMIASTCCTEEAHPGYRDYTDTASTGSYPSVTIPAPPAPPDSSGCGNNCLACENDIQTCALCRQGYGWDDTMLRCRKCSDENCYHCAQHYMECAACTPGMGVSSRGICEACGDPNCARCGEDNQQCTDCAVAYTLDDAGTCVLCRTTGCKTCSISGTECMACHENMELTTNGRCQECPTFCGKCSGGSCAECVSYSGFDNDGRCRRCADPKCGICQDDYRVCEVCADGFALTDDGECVRCAGLDCISCAPDSGLCAGCFPGYQVDSLGDCRACSLQSVCVDMMQYKGDMLLSLRQMPPEGVTVDPSCTSSTDLFEPCQIDANGTLCCACSNSAPIPVPFTSSFHYVLQLFMMKVFENVPLAVCGGQQPLDWELAEALGYCGGFYVGISPLLSDTHDVRFRARFTCPGEEVESEAESEQVEAQVINGVYQAREAYDQELTLRGVLQIRKGLLTTNLTLINMLTVQLSD